jgi:phosphate transport system protein
MPTSTGLASSNRRHIVRAYDRELLQLRALVLDMAEAAVAHNRAAVGALTDGDPLRAHQVIEDEPRLDALSLAVDEEIFRVIAKRQPTAADLRLVLAIGKVAADLERAGDKAVRIARGALRLAEALSVEASFRLPDRVLVTLRRLDDMVCCMLERAIDALTKADVDGAVGVFEDVVPLRALHEELSQLLVADEQGLQGERLAVLLTVAQALERVGNHAASIAEQVVYVVTGEDVRYRNRELLVDALRHRGAPG